MGSLSLFRGQASHGLGEGAGGSIHGEQYLAIDAQLRGDGAIFEAARSWMTLDAREADHQDLRDQLEAWSLFALGGRTGIVRMVTNPHFRKYDKRAAYFAHARIWPLETEFPAAYLGRSDAFDEPWPDEQRTTVSAEGPPEVMGVDSAKNDPDRTARLLGHLYQAHLLGYPVIVVGELPDFARTGDLARALSFALCALPASLRARARMRLFTTSPGLFLTRLGATVVALLKRDAPAALKAAPNAVLLDKDGQKARGPSVHENIGSYAQSVVARGSKLPAGLLPFSVRVDPFLRSSLSEGKPPDTVLLDSIIALYNTAYASTEPGQAGALILKGIKPQITSGRKLLPVELLLPPRPGPLWPAVDGPSLSALLLDDELRARPAEGVPSPGRELLRLAEEELLARKGTLDAELGPWWKREPMGTLRVETLRMETLAGFVERGLATKGAAARLSRGLPMQQLLASRHAGAVLLSAEADASEHGLSARLAEIGSLSQGLLHDQPASDELFEVVLRATLEGALPVRWVTELIAAACREGQAALICRLCLRAKGQERWPPELMTALRSLLAHTLQQQIPEATGRAAQGLLQRLNPADDFDLFLHTAEIVARSGVGQPRCEGALVAAAGRITDRAQRRHIVSAATSGGWLSLGLAALVSERSLALPDWLLDTADLLAADARVASSLEPLALVALWNAVADRPEHARALVAELDQRMRSDPAGLTAVLVQTDSWQRWQEASGLQPTPGDEIWHPIAVCWLADAGWTSEKPTRATRVAWERVMGVLLPAAPPHDGARGLSGKEVSRLVVQTAAASSPRWPWIRPIEDRQLRDLCGCCCDLGGLAELAAAVLPTHLGLAVPDMYAHVVGLSRFAGRLTEAQCALLRLLNPTGPLPPPEPRLLEKAGLLLEYAGHRTETLHARLQRWIDECARQFPEETLDFAVAGEVVDAAFVRTFVVGLAERGQETPELLERVHRLALRLEPSEGPQTELERRLAVELWRDGYFPVARVLYPRVEDDLALEGSRGPSVGLSELGDRPWARCVRALAQGTREQTPWMALCEEDPSAHPVGLLVARLRPRMARLAPELGALLRDNGPVTLAAALTASTELMRSPRRPQAGLPAYDLLHLLAGGPAAHIAWTLVQLESPEMDLSTWWAALFQSMGRSRDPLARASASTATLFVAASDFLAERQRPEALRALSMAYAEVPHAR